ncbi:MAG: acetyl/propionyl/methylcrotonyl-CoA carboxylase subunit alpha [Brevibacterium aurantiacum]|uniref:biotin carboxylase n=1 Tax=Brevibacterium aurantiacum TaxID=273384 RepID=A0A2H1KKC1_BREAU|nr:biotin carboxylase N-terminal domain-containing protein [Brevibacterium aurantiacum]AZT94191.1 acetyl-/propionyl-CoA carboxylase subunit alpha [Brevibacterium aurantiacum]GEB24713.1 acetyl/propionyl-CoA carboxylase subuit alpha [Brevibacterium aurantiacum]SMX99652.1 acetyl-CoA/propionyl-CoA carboxylase, biotin carboxylase, biotin carboxyl carrier protein [Brevibacterium aurantiacum]
MPKILVANRGEIAVRVIRACAHYGHTSVAVYADQDLEAMHTQLADEAYSLPGTNAADTYLNIDAIIAAAKQSGADAVHPGYGFLSENADFAAAVEDAGLIWIGPTADTITALGDKVTARQLAQKVGAPLAPGIDRPLKDAGEVEAFAAEHGLPIIIKAAHGGGGRGMKIVHDLAEVAGAFESATREAVEAFGRSECFVEKFLERPRHVEVQIVGDGQGRVVAVGDRDCSAQRRNQKLIEEAPAPGLSADQRERLHRSAEAICAEVNYRGAGTVEFLLAADSTMTFLEVNTRLQVEHPVTEAVSGVDLVAEQFRIAFGQGLSLSSTPEPRGHAIELRINAEDPGRGFLPTPGRIDVLNAPGGPGVRWDAGVRAGDMVQPAFDSLFAKLIVQGPDRASAIARTVTAAKELHVEGPATVLPCSLEILTDPAFTADELGIHTQWIESELLPRMTTQPRPAPASESSLTRVNIEIDGKLSSLGLPSALLAALGSAGGGAAGAGDGGTGSDGGAAETGGVSAPVPGNLVDYLVADGAEVAEGDDVAVLSAMKMETRVQAPSAGRLKQLSKVGDMVAVGEVFARIE